MAHINFNLGDIFNFGDSTETMDLDRTKEEENEMSNEEFDLILSNLLENPTGVSSEITPAQANAEMTRAMEESDEDQRFKRYTEKELKLLEDSRQSKATKNNTKWGVKLFQDWSREVDGHDVDMATISEGDLCSKLRSFYAEATPKISKKAQEAGSRPAEYHKNTLINVRAAINRHLHDIGRSEIDIVRDKSFKTANNMLDAKLKANVRNGLSRPTVHKAIISKGDFEQINTYLAGDNPVLLRYRVWLNLAIHFVSRGLEFHIQLTPTSFKFLRDENDKEYVVITHETTQKNKQGGLGNIEAPCSDKRMYSTQDDRCPVDALRRFLSKTDHRAQSLFNNCIPEAMSSPQTVEIWYSTKPLKQYQFTRFMGDISRNAKCTQHYTAHCLRATAIQAMSDAGFELRHIMFMSGHHNESSVRSYSRGCTTGQKHQLSAALSAVIQPNSCREIATVTQPTEANITPVVTSDPRLNALNSSTQVASSNNFMSSGLLSHSSFSNWMRTVCKQFFFHTPMKLKKNDINA